MSPGLPAAVLWDMDGTLVDTEPYWIQAEHELVESFGGTWTDEDALALVGSELTVSAAYIRERGPVPLEVDEIVQRLLDRVVQRVRGGIPWQPGARELLIGLGEAGVPCALVTMSYRQLAEAVVTTLPEGAFAAVVTGDEVDRGKPHPEPYLTAAALLGVAAADCIALEDSPTGATSAEAAGCRVVVIPHSVPVPERPGRVLVSGLAGIDPRRLVELVDGRA